MSSSFPIDNSDITWGAWSLLPNGQWHREGQDSSGNWYQDNQDEDISVPRQTPSMGGLTQSLDSLSMNPYSDHYQQPERSLDSGGFNQAPTTQHVQDQGTHYKHKSRSKYAETPEQLEPSHHGYDRGKGPRSSKSDAKGLGHGSSRSHGKSSKSSRSDAKGKGRDLDMQPAIGSSSKHSGSDARDSGYDMPIADEDLPPGGKHATMGVEDMAQQFLPESAQTTPTMSSATYAMPQMPPMPPRAQNFGRLDDDNVPNLPQSLQDVADMYSRGMSVGSSSSSSAVPGTAPYALVEEDDDQLSELTSRPHYSPKHLRSSPVVEEDSPYNENLSQYVVEPSRKFRFGTVFKIMWAEPMGNSRLSKHNKDPVGTGTSISEFGQRNINGTLLYEGIRRFIVVDGTENGARNGNSICVPIATYKRQGCTKHGIKAANHGIIHTPNQAPMMLNGEPQLGVPPIRLLLNQGLQGIEKLALESRINYSKHVTIEHNAVVHIIGQIHQDDLETLGFGVDSCWEKRVRDRKKDKKQQRNKG